MNGKKAKKIRAMARKLGALADTEVKPVEYRRSREMRTTKDGHRRYVTLGTELAPTCMRAMTQALKRQ